MGGLIESRRRIFFSTHDLVTPIYETVGPTPLATFTAIHASPIKELTVAIEPVQSGSGDPSPDNVRPISGFSAVNVWRMGKNLYNPQWISKGGNYINLEGYHTPSTSDENKKARGIYFFTGQTYRLYVNTGLSSNINYGLYAMRTGSTSQITVKSSAQRISIDMTYTAPATGYYCFWLYSTSASSIVLDNLIFQVQVGNGAYTTPAAYSGQLISTSFADNAGTVYGGTLEIRTGVLTVTHQYFTLTSSNSGLAVWAIGSTGHYRIGFYSSNAANPGTSSPFDGCCNCYKVISTSATYSRTTGIGIQSGNVGYIYDPKWDYSGSLPDFKTWLDSNPITMVYKRSSNLTYQLTPEMVRAVVGENHVWSDAANVTVTYRTN